MDLDKWACEFFNVREPDPPPIGVDVRLCPECQRVMSFRHDHYFCRRCPARVRDYQAFKPYYERH